jgi:uncharacterized protein (TIGR02001 family)
MMAPALPAGPLLNAFRNLGICTVFIALVSSSVGAETRIYGALASNYVFRGYSLSDDAASASTGIDWQHPSGAYAGGNLTTVESEVEWDVYAGYTHQFGPFALDFGGTSYEYSDSDYIPGGFREVYVGGQAGPVALSVYRGRSPFGGARYWYGELDAGVPAGPVTIELHYGVTDWGNYRMSDQYVGVARRWRGLDWRLRFTHVEGENDTHYVAAVSKSWRLGR